MPIVLRQAGQERRCVFSARRSSRSSGPDASRRTATQLSRSPKTSSSASRLRATKSDLLDLRRRKPELGGGLRDSQPVELPQHVDAPLPLRQRRSAATSSPERSTGAPPAVEPFRQLGGRQLAPPHDEVDRAVVRDPEEPRLDAIRHAAVAERPVGLEQRRLRDVVTRRCVAQQVRAVGRETVHVPPVQLVERRRLARGEPAAELFVRQASEQERAHVSSTARASIWIVRVTSHLPTNDGRRRGNLE